VKILLYYYSKHGKEVSNLGYEMGLAETPSSGFSCSVHFPPCFDYSGNFGRVILCWHRVIGWVMFICGRQICICVASLWAFCMRTWKS
jgi:hypothetical protein